MDAHSRRPDPKPEDSLDHLSTEELLERLRNANVPSSNPNKQSLAEYLDEEIENEDRSDVIGSDSTEDNEH